MKIISLCDYTGNILRPWAKAGYECICVDIKHSIRKDKLKYGIRLVWGDVRSWWPDTTEDIYAVFAFPPCTHLAISGARDWSKKGLTSLIDALEIVESCRRICAASGKRWFIENPISRLSTIWRPPDYMFDPCDYGGYLKPIGDQYTKKTCLWTGDEFVLPEPKPAEPINGSLILNLPDSNGRIDKRDATPMGFSKAVYEYNKSDKLKS